MRTSTRLMTRGMYREMRGTMRNLFGRLMRNRMIGLKGNYERIMGKTEQRIGRTCAVFGF